MRSDPRLAREENDLFGRSRTPESHFNMGLLITRLNSSLFAAFWFSRCSFRVLFEEDSRKQGGQKLLGVAKTASFSVVFSTTQENTHDLKTPDLGMKVEYTFPFQGPSRIEITRSSYTRLEVAKIGARHFADTCRFRLL